MAQTYLFFWPDSKEFLWEYQEGPHLGQPHPQSSQIVALKECLVLPCLLHQ